MFLEISDELTQLLRCESHGEDVQWLLTEMERVCKVWSIANYETVRVFCACCIAVNLRVCLCFQLVLTDLSISVVSSLIHD